MKIVFAGTPEFALPGLQALIATNAEIVGVFTQPDRPAGRGRKLKPSPVKELANEQKLPVFQPVRFDSLAIQHLCGLAPDLMVVAAYGLILPESVLSIPRLGCINIHASLLPRWRGAAPIARAIASGDRQTGICLMQMETGLDSGDILAQIETNIEASDTAQSLHDRLAMMGGRLLKQSLDDIKNGLLVPKRQNSESATYARKLSKAEAPIDWQASADEIDRKIRAFNPWPVATTGWNEATLRIWDSHLVTLPGRSSIRAPKDAVSGEVVAICDTHFIVQTGNGQVAVKTVQKAGGKILAASAFINGTNLSLGDQLT